MLETNLLVVSILVTLAGRFSSVAAQSSTETLWGTVVDLSSAVVPQVSITVESIASGVCRAADHGVRGQGHCCSARDGRLLNRNIGGLKMLYQIVRPRSIQLVARVQF